MLPFREFVDRLARGESVAGTPRAPLVVTGDASPADPPPSIGHAVRVRHVRFETPVSFAETRFARSVRFEACTFTQGLVLADARIDGSFSLAHSHVASPSARFIDLRRLSVARVADCTGASARAPLDFRNARLGDDLRLDGLRVVPAPSGDARWPDAATRRHVEEELAGKAICLEGAEVAGHVYLQALPGRAVRLAGALDLRARIGGSLGIVGARLGRAPDAIAIHADGLSLAGSWYLHESRVVGRVDVRGRIDGTLQLVDTTIDAAPSGLALSCERLVVGGGVYCVGGCRVTGEVRFRVRAGGQIVLSGLQVEVAGGRCALDMEQAKVGESVLIRDGCRLGGAVRLNALEAGGAVECLATAIGQPGQDAEEVVLSLEHARLGSKLLVNGESTLHGSLSGLSLAAASVRLQGVIAGRAVFGAAVLRGDFDAVGLRAGALWLLNASLGGNLQLGRARLGRPVETRPADARLADPGPVDATPQDLVLLAQHLHVQGDILADFLRVGRPARAPSLFDDFAHARIRGTIEMRGADVDGFLNLEAAEVGGDVCLTATRIRGPLQLRGARVAGRALGGVTGGGPHVEGAVDLRLAHVRKLSLALDEPLAGAADVTRSGMAGVLLADARVDTLEARGTFDPSRHDIEVDGLSFGGLDVSALDTRATERRRTWRDAVRAVSWLALLLLALSLLREPAWRAALGAWGAVVAGVWIAQQRGATRRVDARLLGFLAGVRFSRGFYLDVERDLRQRGDDAAADEVFLSRRKREARLQSEGMPRLTAVPRRAWAELLDLSVGYGVRVSRAAHLWVLSWFLATGLFSNPASVERPLGFEARSAAEAPAPAPNPWSDDGGLPDAWTTGDAFWLASRLQLPFVALPAVSGWAPSSRPVPGLGLSYENLASGFVLANAILLPLILAGATGILKKTE